MVSEATGAAKQAVPVPTLGGYKKKLVAKVLEKLYAHFRDFESDSGACTFFRGVPHPHLLGVQLLSLFFVPLVR
jgi:hypothetical protein